MDRKDARAVLEADDGVGGAALEEQPPQRGTAMIRSQPPRQDEPEASTLFEQADAAFDKQLVLVGVTVGTGLVDARLTDKAGQLPRHASSRSAHIIVSRVAAHHFPWRVAEDGVEARRVEGHAVSVEEHLGKLERPVQEPAFAGNPLRLVEPGLRGVRRQARRARTKPRREVPELGGAWLRHRCARPEPARAPEVRDAAQRGHG